MSRRGRSLALVGALLVTLAWPSSKAAADNYGAIAFSQRSGAIGYSFDHWSRAAAEARALTECAGRCRVVLWFRNGCGALAVGHGNGFGSGWATNQWRAQRIAVAVCRRQGVQGCSVRQWVCTTR